MSDRKDPRNIFLLKRDEPDHFDAFENDATLGATDPFELWAEPAPVEHDIERSPATQELVKPPPTIRLLPVYRRSVPLEAMLTLQGTLTQELELNEKPSPSEFLLRAYLKTAEREHMPFTNPCLVTVANHLTYELVALPAGSSFTAQLARPRVAQQQLPENADVLLIDLSNHAADDVLLHETAPTIIFKRVTDDEGNAMAQLGVRGDVTPLQANSLLAGIAWLFSEPLRLVL